MHPVFTSADRRSQMLRLSQRFPVDLPTLRFDHRFCFLGSTQILFVLSSWRLGVLASWRDCFFATKQGAMR